jgi:hypothetical protein
MIRLKNIGTKAVTMTITRVPLSYPEHSPNPPKIQNPSRPTEKIPNPAMFSEADSIQLPIGKVVEFDGKEDYNLEQAEYLYMTLGIQEDGGQQYPGGPRLKNHNTILEVNEKGEETKDNLFKKYRNKNSVEVMTDLVRTSADVA